MSKNAVKIRFAAKTEAGYHLDAVAITEDERSRERTGSSTMWALRACAVLITAT